MPAWDAADAADWADNFQLVPGETLAEVLERYTEVARRTAEIVAALRSLDVAHPLPAAPWFEPGATWSARRVLLHVIAETSQHAGHADSSGSPSTARSRWAEHRPLGPTN